MAAGEAIKEYRASGEIMVQRLEGRIAFTALSRTEELTAGQMLYLTAEAPHWVRSIEDASILLTILMKS